MAVRNEPFRPARNRTGGPLCLLAVGLVILSGCGLSEYEGKMAEEQKRLRYLDEENKNLEGPLEFAPKKRETDKDAKPLLPEELFVRLPKGIARKPDELPISGIAYRYRAAATNAPFSEIFLVVTKEPSATFLQDVQRVLNSSCTSISPKPIQRPGREAGQFEAVPFEMGRDPQTGLSFYFYRAQGFQVALVFHTNDTANTAIEYSLGSLFVGPLASQQHKLFKDAATPSGSGSRGGR